MIHNMRYVCSTTGYERNSQNVSYESEIDFDLDSDYESSRVKGMIYVKTYMVINCICGENHRFLVDADHTDVYV